MGGCLVLEFGGWEWRDYRLGVCRCNEVVGWLCVVPISVVPLVPKKIDNVKNECGCFLLQVMCLWGFRVSYFG